MADSLSIPIVDQLALEQLARRTEEPLVLEFWASWCAPCRHLTEALASHSTSYQGRLQFARVDIDAAPDLAETFDIGFVPTLLVLHQGQEVTRKSGIFHTEELLAFLEGAVLPN